MRLIDADTVRRIIDSPRSKIQMLAVLEQTPTVDAVEVIHCGHCRHHENDSSSDSHWCFVWETFTDNHVYCSFAERRQDD